MTNQQIIKNLEAAWHKGDYEMLLDSCADEPHNGWQAILLILKSNLTEEQMALLAAGPLEVLLATHGLTFIELVENEAKVNDRFNYLLGGVWRQEMHQNIWDRITKVRKVVW